MTTASDMELKVGTRSSRLAVAQTRDALDRLHRHFPMFDFQVVTLSSPGDRDRTTALSESPDDFFTRDLDDSVVCGELDCAIHSAKDVPDPVRDGLDWFWLPWRADPRDALICPLGQDMQSVPAAPCVGVSSDRRRTYGRWRFPDGKLCPIRGNIEERLEQLDDGTYDVLIMAAAALVRLGLEQRITEWIPLEDLPPADGQGYLCLTFREGDERFLRMRSLFVKSVTFASAGVGSSGTCTLDSIAALRECDVCIHDVLMGPGLLNALPPGVLRIDAGKRCGRHNVPQEEITRLITVHARRGHRVARLKGGDPGIFGRLAEEAVALDALHLPYRALPGVTSLTAATTTTGMLLTRRGVSRGFTVMTPRRSGGEVAGVGRDERAALPIVLFMAVAVADDISRQLMQEGLAPDTPAAVVFGGGGDQAEIVSARLSEIGSAVANFETDLPGLLLVGDVLRYRFPTGWGAMRGQRVLLTVSEGLQPVAGRLVTDFGGVPVARPLIRLVPTSDAQDCLRRVAEFDWIVLTSPAAVRCFGQVLRQAEVDLRRIPTLVSCGSGTSRELRALGLQADIEPETDFGAEGLQAAIATQVTPGLRVLRLRSDKAGPFMADSLRQQGAVVTDCVLYGNERVSYEDAPRFDAVLFASASAVEAFADLWGMDRLAGKTVVAIGKPTVTALRKQGADADIVGPEATVESSITELAGQYVRSALQELLNRR